MDRIRLLLADDHALLREALKPPLNSQPDMEVAAEAATAAETLRQAMAVDPHIILLDITFPDRSGISLLPDLRQRCPSSRVVMLTMHDDPTYLRSALAAGAAGYVVKSSRLNVLLDAIRTVQRGEAFVDPSMRQHETELAKSTRSAETAPIARLSDREREVLGWLTRGLRYQAIAEKMGISVKTVETYRSRLTTKLGFKSRADLMRFAIESGLLADPKPES
jgi:DNA-binding NarL/FixJ family response regulator